MADSNNTDGGQMNPRQQQAEDTVGSDGRSLVHLLPDLSPVGTQMFGSSIVVGDDEAWNAIWVELRVISSHILNSKHWFGTDENGRRTINSMHWFIDNEQDGPPVGTLTFPDGTIRYLSGATSGQDAEVAETETAN